jgi:hypothetical protein
VAIDPRQIHRVRGRDGAQLVVRRELRVGPIVLIPRAAEDPLPRLRRGDALPHEIDDLLIAGGASQIQRAQELTESGEVTVCIVQTGQHRRAAQVDYTCRRPAKTQHVGLRPNLEDTVALNRDRFGDRVRAIDGVDARVMKYQIGGARRPLRKGERGPECGQDSCHLDDHNAHGECDNRPQQMRPRRRPSTW